MDATLLQYGAIGAMLIYFIWKDKSTFEMYKNQNIERDAMTTLSKDLKSELQKDFVPLAIELVETVEAEDTTKFAFKTKD